ncbi:MAG TPA: hypothetical protein VGE76_21350 [Opitutaceae bacterium]
MPSVLTTGRKSIAQLREELGDRLTNAHRTAARALRTGIPALDEATGGIPLAAVTEVVCAAPSSGSHLLVGQLLAVTRQARQRVALVDSHDSFDPASFSTDALAHLIWVRCTGTAPALQAADLLARDANLSLVVLDLRRAPEADLRRISGPQWYRFQRAVESTDLALVVTTPRPSVPSAQIRFLLNAPPGFASLQHERPGLVTALAPALQRQRLQITAAG